MQDQAICLFDGICMLCNRSVQYILRHEKAPTITFIAVQSARGQSLAEQYEIDPHCPDTFLFLENDKMLKKSDAVIAVSRHLKGVATVVRYARFIPKFMRDFAYDRVAANRIRWFGQVSECSAPTPDTKHRFVL